MADSIWLITSHSFAQAEILANKLTQSRQKVESLQAQLYAAGLGDTPAPSTISHSHHRLNGPPRNVGRPESNPDIFMTPNRRREHEFEQSMLQQMKESRLYAEEGVETVRKSDRASTNGRHGSHSRGFSGGDVAGSVAFDDQGLNVNDEFDSLSTRATA